MIRVIITALAFTFSLAAHEARAASGPCEGEMLRAAARYNVPLGVLYSVGLTETGRGGSLHPFALNIAGKPLFPRSARAAKRAFANARAGGENLIDVGCMQINYRYHGHKFAGVDAMLDPEKNVDYAARFLTKLKGRHESWTMAVARYHAGPDNDAAQKRYICHVISNMVASGFGQWTAKAKSFCK